MRLIQQTTRYDKCYGQPQTLKMYNSHICKSLFKALTFSHSKTKFYVSYIVATMP